MNKKQDSRKVENDMEERSQASNGWSITATSSNIILTANFQPNVAIALQVPATVIRCSLSVVCRL